MKFFFIFLILGLLPVSGLACYGGAGPGGCQKSETTAGKGCIAETNNECFIRGDSTCYRIRNSTGANIFVPTNSATEWANFITNVPANVYVTTHATGATTCRPTCYHAGNCGQYSNALPRWGSPVYPP